MTTRDDDLAVLSRGLDQATQLLDGVPTDRLGDPTPCEAWTVADLLDHLVQAPRQFAVMARGESVDWSAPTPHVESGWAEEFRAGADELLHALDAGGEAGPGLDWQCAEIAVHTWDVSTALGRPTTDLEPQVAERGLAFMRANLKPEMRSAAFKEEQPAPEGADAYGRIAAFAGRVVTPSR